MDINEPITRAEAILSGEDLEPMSRIEYFLKKAANGGGGGNLVAVSDGNGNVTLSLNNSSQSEESDNRLSHLIVGENDFEIYDSAARNAIGSPLVASTVADMTDTSKVYVYTGSETGYTSGNWYYYDGSAWVSGGIYNSTAFETDETLSVEGAAADAKAVGDAIGELIENEVGKAGVLEDSASGDVVTIVPDKSVGKLYKAEVSLSPIQSLNGYDHPWPAGSTKNLFSASFVKGKNITTASGGDVVDNSSRCATVDYIAVTGGQTYTLSKNNTTNVGVFYYDANKDYIDEYLGWDATPRTFTVPSEASYVRFSYYSSTVPTNVQLEVGQTATDYIPCSNICPIVGHDSATLNVARKNVSSVSSCTSTINGNLNTSSGNFGTCFANVKYTISFDVLEQNAAEVRLRFNNGSNIKTWASGAMTVGSRLSFTYTPTNDGSFNFNTSSHSFSASATVFDNIQVEVGETATAYEPYSATTYTVTFGQTVYGGTLDFVSGKLVVDMASVDLGTLTYTYMSLSGGRNAFVAHIDGIVSHASNDVPINAISSAYKAVSYNTSWKSGDMSYTRNATGADDKQEVTFVNNSYTDAAAFKTAMSGQTLVYELATPIEIDLEPTEVQTLIGTNNVWSDGEMSVDYAADLKTYIDNKIAAAVAALS